MENKVEEAYQRMFFYAGKGDFDRAAEIADALGRPELEGYYLIRKEQEILRKVHPYATELTRGERRTLEKKISRMTCEMIIE